MVLAGGAKGARTVVVPTPKHFTPRLVVPGHSSFTFVASNNKSVAKVTSQAVEVLQRPTVIAIVVVHVEVAVGAATDVTFDKAAGVTSKVAAIEEPKPISKTGSPVIEVVRIGTPRSAIITRHAKGGIVGPAANGLSTLVLTVPRVENGPNYASVLEADLMAARSIGRPRGII